MISVISGVVIFFATGSDFSLRLGVVVGAIAALLWIILLAIINVKAEIKAKQYLRSFITGTMYGGITLFLLYFFLFLLSEMLRVNSFGQVPTPVDSKITTLGALLILLAVIIALIDTAIRYSKKSK